MVERRRLRINADPTTAVAERPATRQAHNGVDRHAAAIEPASDMGGAAPPKNNGAAHPDPDPVALGREAWERRKADVRASWEDWKLIGEALLVGRRQAMEAANTSRPVGRKYAEEFHNWLQTHSFDEIDNSDRSKLLRIMENLEQIEVWRETLTDSQRLQINHPSTVWRVSRCKNRGIGARPRTDPAAHPSRNAVDAAARPDDSEDELQAWQRGLLLRANKVCGDARLHGLWALPEAPDSGIAAAVHEAADAWVELGGYIDSIVDMSPDELADARDNRDKHQSRKSEARARKSERRREQAKTSVGAA